MSQTPPPKPEVVPGQTTSPASPPSRRRNSSAANSMLAYGEPMVWLTSGALSLAVVMILCLLAFVLYAGLTTFWPVDIQRFVLKDGTVYMGQVTRDESFEFGEDALNLMSPEEREMANAAIAQGQPLKRELVRTANFDITQTHFHWVEHYKLAQPPQTPEWAVLLERLEWGRFYGTPVAFLIDDEVVADTPAAVWEQFQKHHGDAVDRRSQIEHLAKDVIGDLNFLQNHARLETKQALLNYGEDSPEYAQAQAQEEKVLAQTQAEQNEANAKILALREENARFDVRMAAVQRIVDGEEVTVEKDIELGEIVRLVRANQIGFGEKVSLYIARWWEFLSADPREANSEGGVFPAIFGTVLMTLIMCVLVVPFGVLAALYLREYAKAGPMTSAVRIAINNLAGVPSIVFGVFGLGFFCYIVGASIDELLFEANLPNPTFGKGALIWASFTLALLTLPVVIVSTEESLAAVPNSMREGSYACGASKWQTIQRIVLPRAMPGIMTGTILAMARGAGEVAPLMLVGAVKLAPELPFSTSPAEQFGVNRSFMHLGFHIYDLGFQSQNSEAAKPMVYTTTLLLISIIAILNIAAVLLRARLRRKFHASQF